MALFNLESRRLTECCKRLASHLVLQLEASFAVGDCERIGNCLFLLVSRLAPVRTTASNAPPNARKPWLWIALCLVQPTSL